MVGFGAIFLFGIIQKNKNGHVGKGFISSGEMEKLSSVKEPFLEGRRGGDRRDLKKSAAWNFLVVLDFRRKKIEKVKKTKKSYEKREENFFAEEKKGSQKKEKRKGRMQSEICTNQQAKAKIKSRIILPEVFEKFHGSKKILAGVVAKVQAFDSSEQTRFFFSFKKKFFGLA